MCGEKLGYQPIFLIMGFLNETTSGVCWTKEEGSGNKGWTEAYIGIDDGLGGVIAAKSRWSMFQQHMTRL